MTTISISRFYVTRTGYSRLDEYLASVSPCPGHVSLEQHLGGLVQQINRFEDEPTGWHFGRWKNHTNDGANVLENHAVTLTWGYEAADRLAERLAELGWAHLVVTGENRKGSRATITVAFPLAQPLTEKAKYARIASVLAYQIGIGGMEPTLTAHTFMIHAHRQTRMEMVDGPLISPATFIKQTEHYPARNAHRWHDYQPVRAASAQLDEPTFTTDPSGLFEFPESKTERAARPADEYLTAIGVTLR